MEFSLEQIPQAAEQIITRARHSTPAAPQHATLITFSGDLGAGKTTLIKEIARQLGVTDDLASPTFVIYKKYKIGGKNTTHPLTPSRRGGIAPWKYLVHGDMYRLNSAQDILKLDWQELLSNPENILCVEWPEQIADAIPDWAIRVSLAHKGETRILDIDK